MSVYEFENVEDAEIAVPYTGFFNLVSKFNIKKNCDLPREEKEKCMSHVWVFGGAHTCVTFVFDSLLEYWQVEEKRLFLKKILVFSKTRK